MTRRSAYIVLASLCLITVLASTLMAPILWEKCVRIYHIRELVMHIEGRRSTDSRRLAWMYDELEQVGLTEEALTAVLPYLQRPGPPNRRARMIINFSQTPLRMDVGEALFKMGNDSTFDSSDRIDALGIVLLRHSDPGVRRSAEAAIRTIIATLPANAMETRMANHLFELATQWEQNDSPSEHTQP